MKSLRTSLIAVFVCCFVLAQYNGADAELIEGFRPPSIPLLMMDPFVNIWVNANNLTGDWTKLWTGTIKAWTGYIRIDGQTFAYMGPTNSGSINIPAMYQQSVTVFPTRTLFVFNQNGIELNVTFASPQIPTDMDLLGLPTNYISYSLRSVDARAHQVELYYDNTAEITAATVSEVVTWDRQTVSSPSGPLTVLRTGTTAQNVFGNYGDWVGIDWGYIYVSTLSVPGSSSVMAGSVLARQQFITYGTLPSSDDTNKPRAIDNNWPVLCLAWNLSITAGSQIQERHVTIAYDEISPIKWFNTPFQSYWKGPSGSKTIQNLLSESEQNYASIMSTLQGFDESLIQNLTNKGGDHYATVSSLAFRQVMAGTKLVWNTILKTPWYFMKEISSDGDLSTVDVIFPASPFFIYHNPELLKLLLLPILAYGNNETFVKYNYPWAPHHLGFYPVGYILPKDQENMPMEESGNMILMILAVIQKTNNSYSWLLPKYAPLLKSWVDYLVSALPSPGTQLCTDDFLGPIYNDANLAAKGIVALSAYAEIMKISGNNEDYNKYSTLATKFVSDWKKLAVTYAENKMHYKLSYNQTDSWSLKYNIAYEKFLNLRVFGSGVMGTELDWYEANIQTFGAALQQGVTFTKLDWQYWIASGFSRSEQEWRKWSELLYNWVDNGQTRVPLTDWYDIVTGNQKGFQARPVVGALWSKMIIN